MKDSDYLLKIVVVGSQGVGKSNLALRYVQNDFNLNQPNTIGSELSTKRLVMENGKTVKAHIWDTAGQEKFKAVSTFYYQKAQGALLVYDITDRKSFEDIQQWLKEVNNYAPLNCVKLLVGNKKDLSQIREVTTDEAIQLAEEKKLAFIECSALDATNVDKAFEKVINEIFKKLEKSAQLESQNSLKKLRINNFANSYRVKKDKCC